MILIDLFSVHRFKVDVVPYVTLTLDDVVTGAQAKMLIGGAASVFQNSPIQDIPNCAAGRTLRLCRPAAAGTAAHGRSRTGTSMRLDPPGARGLHPVPETGR